MHLAPEGQLYLAVQDREHLLEVMTMRWRAATKRHEHVDQAVAAARLFASHKDRVGAAGDRDVTHLRIVWVGHRSLLFTSSGGIAARGGVVVLIAFAI